MEDAATREGAAAHEQLALIAAGGEGRRLGSLGPKALVECAGRPLLGWTLDAFAGSAAFARGAGLVVVAAHAAELEAFEAACVPARERGLAVVVTPGGPSRSHSVAAALRAGIEAQDRTRAGAVFVHDAARIFVTGELIDGLATAIATAEGDVDGVIAAHPVADTIKLVDADRVVVETPPRERLWAVQTPQVFRRSALAAALGLTSTVSDDRLAAATDDASLVETSGGKVTVFQWTAANGKITTPEDLAAAESLLTRSGS
jgi:2-C-methyl-D-erythritol 4-phosphate cytidylyltransferase